MKGSFVVMPLIGLASVVLMLGLLGFRVNLTTSLPLGVYRTTSEAPRRGSVVNVCLPLHAAEFARTRGYLGPGSCPGGVRPLGKVVLAVTGDVVTLSRDNISVNGRVVANSATVSEDSHGRPLPHSPWGVHRLRPGEVWLFAPYHRSAYDSRYFGPVLSADVITVLRPLWTTARRNGPVTSGPRSSSTSRDLHSRPAPGTTAQTDQAACAR